MHVAARNSFIARATSCYAVIRPTAAEGTVGSLDQLHFLPFLSRALPFSFLINAAKDNGVPWRSDARFTRDPRWFVRSPVLREMDRNEGS